MDRCGFRAAEDVSTEELQQFLASKREWVYRRLAEKEVLQHEPVTKELVDGEGFLYLGRSHRLKLTEADGAVRLERGRLVLPKETPRVWRRGTYRVVPNGVVRRGYGRALLSWAERLRVDDMPDRGR